MADEPIHVSDYDPAWPGRFAGQRDQVSAVLAPWLAAPVEHIGSTPVPGLPAKPIIDMLAPVRSLAGAQDVVLPLREDGWVFWPEDPCRYYRLWFLRPRPEARTHHLQVIEVDTTTRVDITSLVARIRAAAATPPAGPRGTSTPR